MLSAETTHGMIFFEFSTWPSMWRNWSLSIFLLLIIHLFIGLTQRDASMGKCTLTLLCKSVVFTHQKIVTVVIRGDARIGTCTWIFYISCYIVSIHWSFYEYTTQNCTYDKLIADCWRTILMESLWFIHVMWHKRGINVDSASVHHVVGYWIDSNPFNLMLTKFSSRYKLSDATLRSLSSWPDLG